MLTNLKTDRGRDRALAAKIAEGNQDAFAFFIDKYSSCVKSIARRYSSNSADCEDLIQDSFIALYKGIHSYRGDAALSTWIFSVTLNVCRKACERSPMQAASIDELLIEPLSAYTSSPEKCAADAELSAQVDSALRELSPEHRDVVVLHELQQLTYTECATVLSIPLGTVKSRLYYAIKLLKNSLHEYVTSDFENTNKVSQAQAATESMI